MANEARAPHAGDASPRQALGEMAMGFFRGKVLCAAVRLGVADALAGGPRTVDELAAATKTHPGALLRLLRTLASLGVVEELEPRRFALTAFGEPLRRDAPDSVWASVVFWADLLADSWTYLPDCIRTGDRSGAEAARQREGASSRWSRDPDAKAIFHAAFAEARAEDFAPLVAALDLASCRVVADLGGAGGGLLAAVLAAHPRTQGVLVERQEALGGAATHFEAHGLTARCKLVAGDLLESVPAGANVYLMRCVLHGYDDEAALRILRHVREALTPEGRLLLIEVVLPDRIARPDPELEKLLMSDLNMLAVTSGRERSELEWNALLSAADLTPRRVLHPAGQTCGIVEAVRRR